jgi:phosphoribosyl 1,2-cyclic phosphodiesterase
MEWIFLASGSSGNASIVRWGETCVLLDAGITFRKLESCLAKVKIPPEQIQAVVLSHTHSDHCNPLAIRSFLESGVPVLLDGSLIGPLKRKLKVADDRHLIPLKSGAVREILPGWLLHTHPLPHGEMPNLGIVLEVNPGLFEPALRLAYLTDLGTWNDKIAEFAAGCDLLGLEFNHDEEMQQNSNRPSYLIARNLGDGGHLSNNQAANCFKEILVRSGERKPRALIQLHLSRQCNKPALALQSAQSVVQSISASYLQVKTCKPGSNQLRIPWDGYRGRLFGKESARVRKMSGSNGLNRPSKANVVAFKEDSQLVLFPME